LVLFIVKNSNPVVLVNYANISSIGWALIVGNWLGKIKPNKLGDLFSTVANSSARSGLPDFSRYNKPVLKKIYQHGHRKYQMRIKYQMILKYSKFFIPRPSLIYQNWRFWYEIIPSGNHVPGTDVTIF
jgi:hypothetical protein